MSDRIQNNPKIDPRIKAALAMVPMPDNNPGDIASREALLEEQNSVLMLAVHKGMEQMMALCDTEEIAPSEGLTSEHLEFESTPDGNVVPLQLIRPAGDEPLPCVYYIHGGGMQYMSSRYGNYQAWGRLMAARGVAVALIDFRNAVLPSSAPEVAPFPAGLNDCVSGVHWLHANAERLGIDSGRIVVAGESGGGNLTLATGMQLLRDGQSDRVAGLYAICPFIAGTWPLPENPSSTEFEGVVLTLHNNRSAIAYGIEAWEARNPLAWPGFAQADDVRGLPPTAIHVNECDPLCDEGIGFYRLLLEAGVAASCRVALGTTHGAEIFVTMLPEATRELAGSIADFCRGVTRPG